MSDRRDLVQMADTYARFAEMVFVSQNERTKTKRRERIFVEDRSWKIVGGMCRETATRKREQRWYLAA